MRGLFSPRRSDPAAAATLSHAEFVRAAYLAVLRREPDVEGLQAYCGQLGQGVPPEAVLRSLLDSSEFAASQAPGVGIGPVLMENAVPNHVEADVDGVARDRLWDRIARSWNRMGDADPYWSVVTDSRWRKTAMSDEEALAAFYETGWPDIHRLDAWFGRNGLVPPHDGICAEYGCGVGRVTRLLARRFRTVRAFDISAPHLAAAQARLSAEGIDNVEYVLVRRPGDLSALSGCDLFFSFIVLQHNPPPVIAHILAQAMAGLRGGGTAFFQVPIWSTGYGFRTEQYLGTEEGGTEEGGTEGDGMEMHCLPQSRVFAIARDHGCEAVEAQPDGCAGPDYVSNIFLLRKRD